MSVTHLLIANRGEIAVRIAQAAADLGIRTLSVYSDDDAQSLHCRRTDATQRLAGVGAQAYLDGEAIIQVALAHGCDAIHPGYGFLSESAAFARRCEQAGLVFVGPTPEMLDVLGDKARARDLARRCGVALLPGTAGGMSLAQVEDFVRELGDTPAAMIKAVSGGGGRGMRVVRSVQEVPQAYARCQSEALRAFGNDSLYVEKLVERARHIEVQVVGDGQHVAHVFERECTLQRRHQKLIEVAPAPGLDPVLRTLILNAALALAREFPYRSLGTFEFLVDQDPALSVAEAFYFMEANPRLQVEHTVTESLTGLDLVQIQLRIAAGQTLHEVGLSAPLPEPQGYAIECRINAESMTEQAQAHPEGGTLERFEPPTGRGVRVDTFAYGGYRTHPGFDSLLAKLIVRCEGPNFDLAIARTRRVLREFTIKGVRTNLDVLDALLGMEQVAHNAIHTTFIESNIAQILARAQQSPLRWVAHACKGDADDTASIQQAGSSSTSSAPAGAIAVTAPLQGKLCSLMCEAGAVVGAQDVLLVIESMKMEHSVLAGRSGRIMRVDAEAGQFVGEGDVLVYLHADDVQIGQDEQRRGPLDSDAIRDDLARVQALHDMGLDHARPDAVARRRARGQRTARENVTDLCDEGSFTEYGALIQAAQRQRRTSEELARLSPADGLIAGIGTVNAALFGAADSRCMVLAYDFTVFAGTQGWMNHKKTDRMLGLALQWKLPVVLFGEGGGGRPGETEGLSVHGLDTPTFFRFASLSGKVPLVAIVSGRCFAGNAALVGCCDVIVATRNANLGMSGPAMIEGGGLGTFAPEEIGPVSVQEPNGVIDIVVDDETQAVRVAQQYLSYFQGALQSWQCGDQRMLRHMIPEHRRTPYLIRDVIDCLVDQGSVLELRAAFAPGMVTALIRVEGKPMGLMANNAMHLGGAVDARAADKASAFMRLCNTFDLPILSLCDTPGFMVGPQAEKSGQVRSSAGMFLAAASLTVPVFTIVLRKGYGLGAQSMAGGCFHAPMFNVAWPTGEFGGMGIEGAVRLGFKNELQATPEGPEREAFFDAQVARLYEQGTGTNMAASMEIDDVIDPADTRHWIRQGLMATGR